MLDLRWLSDHLDEARQRTALRRADVDFDRLAELIERRRSLIHEAETARYEQRQAQQKMKSIDKRSEAFGALRDELRSYSERAKTADQERKAVVEALDALLLEIPNLIHESVPPGTTEDDNEVVRVWGEPTTFDFPPKDHQDLGEALGLLDLERAGKVTGSRFAFLSGPLARLNRVLIDFMLDLHTGEHGYVELAPPFLVNAASMTGTGQLPKFEEDAFRTGDYYLIPTAEVPVTNLYRDEVLGPGQLPKRFVAYSPCFRREAGSYGKDTRGLIRQHQFEKVELVQFVEPDASWEAHEALTRHAEAVLQRLQLPYRVVSLCAGDIGFSATKCYDLEVWLPSQERYREISSCSHFGDFQARRAGIRFRRDEKSKPEYVHTLNGSGLALGRTLLAIVENYQQADGSIRIPDVLVERMGTAVIGSPAEPGTEKRLHGE